MSNPVISDGTDGKQARRTNSGSPLGELLDHGCDSWVMLFLTCTILSLLGDGLSTVRIFSVQWVIILTFSMSHWEHFILGSYFLPWAYDIAQLVSLDIVSCLFELICKYLDYFVDLIINSFINEEQYDCPFTYVVFQR